MCSFVTGEVLPSLITYIIICVCLSVCLPGRCEVEVSYGGEADLHQHLIICEKNAGHHDFIPVDSFNIDHLPCDFRDETIFEFFRVVADLVVCVSVKYVSKGRLNTWPGTNQVYPCYKDRQKDMMRTATGMLYSVSIHRERDNKTCPCKKCFTSKTPETQFAHIYIMTAAHVVFDELEAEQTTCHLFFDRGSSPAACSGVITLTDMSFVRSNIEWDMCEMSYVTHDLDLAERLDKILKKYYQLQNIIGEEKVNKCPKPDLDQSPVVIVSHPHGCSKQVSVGRCISVNESKGGSIQYIYTTPTCPGSSGARVFVLGRDWLSSWVYRIHMGNYEGDDKQNCSGFAYFWWW